MGFLQGLFGKRDIGASSRVSGKGGTTNPPADVSKPTNAAPAPPCARSAIPPLCLHLDPRQGDQEFEEADYYRFETGTGSTVDIRYDEWEAHDPDLERPKKFDEKFYNEVSPEDFARLFRQLARTRRGDDRDSRWRFLIKCAYARRESAAMRTLAEELCRTYFGECAHDGATCRYSDPYVMYAALLSDQGQFDQAIALCQQAETLAITDRTKGGLAARIERLRRQQTQAAKGLRRGGKTAGRPEDAGTTDR